LCSIDGNLIEVVRCLESQLGRTSKKVKGSRPAGLLKTHCGVTIGADIATITRPNRGDAVVETRGKRGFGALTKEVASSDSSLKGKRDLLWPSGCRPEREQGRRVGEGSEFEDVSGMAHNCDSVGSGGRVGRGGGGGLGKRGGWYVGKNPGPILTREAARKSSTGRVEKRMGGHKGESVVVIQIVAKCESWS